MPLVPVTPRRRAGEKILVAAIAVGLFVFLVCIIAVYFSDSEYPRDKQPVTQTITPLH